MKPLYIVLIVIVVLLIIIGYFTNWFGLSKKTNSMSTCRTAQGAEGVMTGNGCTTVNGQLARTAISNNNSLVNLNTTVTGSMLPILNNKFLDEINLAKSKLNPTKNDLINIAVANYNVFASMKSISPTILNKMLDDINTAKSLSNTSINNMNELINAGVASYNIFNSISGINPSLRNAMLNEINVAKSVANIHPNNIINIFVAAYNLSLTL